MAPTDQAAPGHDLRFAVVRRAAGAQVSACPAGRAAPTRLHRRCQPLGRLIAPLPRKLVVPRPGGGRYSEPGAHRGRAYACVWGQPLAPCRRSPDTYQVSLRAPAEQTGRWSRTVQVATYSPVRVRARNDRGGCDQESSPRLKGYWDWLIELTQTIDYTQHGNTGGDARDRIDNRDGGERGGWIAGSLKTVILLECTSMRSRGLGCSQPRSRPCRAIEAGMHPTRAAARRGPGPSGEFSGTSWPARQAAAKPRCGSSRQPPAVVS